MIVVVDDRQLVKDGYTSLFGLGAITHILLTIAKFGEWVGKRLEMEHVHPTWMMLPVGCLVAAMVSPDVLTLKMLCNVWN